MTCIKQRQISYRFIRHYVLRHITIIPPCLFVDENPVPLVPGFPQTYVTNPHITLT